MFSANSSQVSEDRLYVEDVFSTWLYTGTGSAQTITNGIDLSGKGGLVWCKDRTYATSNCLVDTARGTTKSLFTNLTDAQNTTFSTITAFNSNGFTVGTSSLTAGLGDSAMASWTFRKAPKFFDVVTYTGNGVSGRAISHSLGVAPGCIIVKRLNSAAPWQVYHRSLPTNGANGVYNLYLNTTDAQADNGSFTTAASATEFYVGQYGATNGSGDTYVAYLFAHDTTSDGIIQCGSFTTDGSGNATVNLGWEPQWLLLKDTANGASNWITFDTMRGLSQTAINILYPNTSGSEIATSGNYVFPTATGFQVANGALGNNAPNIYIAIRRGPMRTPTSGTSVYNAVSRTGTGATATVNANMTVDLSITSLKGGFSGLDHVVFDRLRGAGRYSATNTTAAEDTFPSDLLTSFATQNGVILGADADPDYNGKINAGGFSYINWYFRRAPSFFDEVCYTGDGGAYNPRPHNLGVTPELIINKNRGSTGSWWVKCSAGSGSTLRLETTGANLGSPGSLGTTTTFNPAVSDGTQTYVAYLFASCPGVSKVFSFTGNGSSQTINCGFSSGARFILIKRTDSTGNWVTFDSARGIVSGNDPSLLLNSTAAETNYDDIDPDSSGFIVNQSTNNLNVNGASYIGLAVA